jgi:curved DNA-binding protein
MKDYYKILGVSEDSSPDEIKKAFRKLAVKHHPDRGGDEKKFKEANEAYDTLKNADKKQEYDTMRRFGSNMGGQGSGFKFHTGNFNEFFGGDFFEEFMSGMGGMGQRQRFRQRPRANKDVSIRITMSIKEIMSSVKRTISVKLPSGRDEIVDVKIGAGIQNGVVLKYSGLGDDSNSNLPRGNLLIRVTILDSDGFTRKGNDLWTDKTINAFDAMRGTEFQIKDLQDNIVKVKVPAGTQPGSVLQLKSKGMPVHESLSIRGNMYIKIHVTIPTLTQQQLNKIKDL